jgi:hypothetical protein
MGKTKDFSKDCKNIVLNLTRVSVSIKVRFTWLLPLSKFIPTSILAVKIGENVKFQMSAAIMKGYG